MSSMLLGAASGCTQTNQTVETKQSFTGEIVKAEPMSVNIKELSSEGTEKFRRAYINTSIEMLKRQQTNGKNVMISPASIMLALSMAESGANGDTKEQMAALWGGEGNSDEQLSYAASILRKLNESNGVKMHAADSMWINDNNLTSYMKQEFIDFVKQNFDAEAENLPFDAAALEKINGWVKDKTDGMIDKIIDELGADTALILINAIAFEGKWGEQYEEYQVREGDFRAASGTTQKVSMLVGTEHTYLESGDATGFAKAYEGGQYAFVTMLPKDENQSIDDFLADLTGDEFDTFLNSKTHQYTVKTMMPEFTSDYSVELSEMLKDMGVTEAFDENKANFRSIADLGEGMNLLISKVFHKTHIEVNRNGTRAAAVTAVTMDVAGAIDMSDTKEVFCNRPYVYAIVDMTDNTPIFIGAVNEV